jgi:hypothetical protein
MFGVFGATFLDGERAGRRGVWVEASAVGDLGKGEGTRSDPALDNESKDEEAYGRSGRGVEDGDFK